MFSQNEEELFIIDYFKDEPIGRFLDIGAFHVFQFSNVRALYERGWSGILVEPAPQNYKGIADHYAGDERVQVLNVAVGDPSGEIDFYESDGDAVGTTDENHMIKWNGAGVKFTKIKVQQIAVETFFNQYGKDIDFLTVDTEATNIAVFRSIPSWVWRQIKMLCIEHDGCMEEIQDKLFNYGFFTYYANAENIILGK